MNYYIPIITGGTCPGKKRLIRQRDDRSVAGKCACTGPVKAGDEYDQKYNI